MLRSALEKVVGSGQFLYRWQLRDCHSFARTASKCVDPRGHWRLVTVAEQERGGRQKRGAGDKSNNSGI